METLKRYWTKCWWAFPECNLNVLVNVIFTFFTQKHKKLWTFPARLLTPVIQLWNQLLRREFSSFVCFCFNYNFLSSSECCLRNWSVRRWSKHYLPCTKVGGLLRCSQEPATLQTKDIKLFWNKSCVRSGLLDCFVRLCHVIPIHRILS
jgi:hypothetical protein